MFVTYLLQTTPIFVNQFMNFMYEVDILDNKLKEKV